MSKRSFIVAFKLYSSETVRKRVPCSNAIMRRFEFLKEHWQPKYIFWTLSHTNCQGHPCLKLKLLIFEMSSLIQQYRNYFQVKNKPKGTFSSDVSSSLHFSREYTAEQGWFKMRICESHFQEVCFPCVLLKVRFITALLNDNQSSTETNPLWNILVNRWIVKMS